MKTARSGGEILIRQLEILGATDAFCVPGESYLKALDALHDSSIRLTICRQEGGACMMAEAAGKLTGKPGICFVTRGPGATNASHGIHIAMQDSTPMILFVGQIGRSMRDREAFQEMDYRAVFGTMAKWVTEIESAERIPEVMSRAWHRAMSGRPGPVVIALPEDMLREMAEVADCKPAVIAEPAPSHSEIEKLDVLIQKAERPLVIVGGSRWSQRTVDKLVRFAENANLPVAVSFRRQSLFPASHPNFAGDFSIAANPKLVSAAREADLIILLGGRFSEMPSQNYSVMDIPNPKQTLVHIHADADELGRVYRPELAICATPDAFLTAAHGISHSGKSRIGHLHDAYENWSEMPQTVPGRFNPGLAIKHLRETVPDRSVLCNGAGNYAAWLHRYYRYPKWGTQLAPTSGSMGYGVPAAVAAARLDRDRPAIALAGDGCFLMNGQEFATAIQYDLPIIVIIMDNGMYGTIRMHQERDYPGRVVGTELKNPDFAAYAEAFGGYGERVERTEDFPAAFERASKSGKPSIIHCIVDPEAISPTKTLSDIRAR